MRCRGGRAAVAGRHLARGYDWRRPSSVTATEQERQRPCNARVRRGAGAFDGAIAAGSGADRADRGRMRDRPVSCVAGPDGRPAGRDQPVPGARDHPGRRLARAPRAGAPGDDHPRRPGGLDRRRRGRRRGRRAEHGQGGRAALRAMRRNTRAICAATRPSATTTTATTSAPSSCRMRAGCRSGWRTWPVRSSR